MSNMSAVDTPCLLAADDDAALDECPLKISVLMPALLRSSLIHRLIDALEIGLCGFWNEIRSGEGSSGVDILKSFVFSSYTIRVFTGQKDLSRKLAKKASFGGPDLLVFVIPGRKNCTPSGLNC